VGRHIKTEVLLLEAIAYDSSVEGDRYFQVGFHSFVEFTLVVEGHPHSHGVTQRALDRGMEGKMDSYGRMFSFLLLNC